MELLTRNTALKILRDTVKGTRHPYYERVTALADKYLKLITGERVDSLLEQFNPRETEGMFKQRKRITKAIVGAVSGKIKGPFEKVARSNNVTRKLISKNENAGTQIQRLESSLSTFWGDESLNEYMEQRMLDLSFSDPNAFIVTESRDINGEVKTFPFEVSSHEAVNYRYLNNHLSYLVVHNTVNMEPSASKASKKPLDKYVIYTKDFSIVAVQIEERKNAQGLITTRTTGTLAINQGDRLPNEPNIEFMKLGGQVFTVWAVENICDEIPAIRIGYKRDEMTMGNTYVSPMQKGIPRLEKTIKSDSELDLTVALHTFPQKMQYVQKCPGNPKEQEVCENGTIKLGKKKGDNCPTCKGSGVLFHTSAQDAILYMMPTQEQLNQGVKPMDLDKLMVYKHPSIELIKFQNEYTRQLESETIRDVFISQTFERTNGSPTTATELNVNMESVYDTLYPFARKFSAVYKKQVRMVNCYINGPNDLSVIHQFPKDLKLKSVQMLIEEYKAANDAGLPEFFKKQIATDIASKIWHDDETALLKYNVKQSHMPFSGKSPQEVQDIINAGRSNEDQTILWIEFENIMQQLEDEQFNADTPRFFYNLTYDERVKLITDKVEEFKEQRAIERGISPLDVDSTVEGDEIDTPIDIEAEAKAKLKGTVGGVQGIIAINQAVARQEMTEQAAEEMLVQIYGFDPKQAAKLIEPVIKVPEAITP